MSKEATDQANQNVVEMVFDGEVVDTYDFSNLTDAQITKLKQKYEKGMLYDKKMHDIGAIERKARQFDDLQKLIGAVKAGDMDKGILLETFKSYGIDLTPEQKAELESPDFDDGTSKMLGALKKDLEDTRKELNAIKRQSMASTIDGAHKELAQKYNGKNGWPVYDPAAIEDFLSDKPLYSPDPYFNYEAAYKLMNEEKIMAARVKEASELSAKDKDRRGRAFSETGEGSPNFKAETINTKGKSWDEINALALAKYGALLDEELSADE